MDRLDQAYLKGFCKVAEAYGVDPEELLNKVAQAPGYSATPPAAVGNNPVQQMQNNRPKVNKYKPIYATQHQIGTLKDNWNAAKDWYKGYAPGLLASSVQIIRDGELTHDAISFHAPTLVDRIHNGWNVLRGKGNLYGNIDHDEPISAQQYDNIHSQAFLNP